MASVLLKMDSVIGDFLKNLLSRKAISFKTTYASLSVKMHREFMSKCKLENIYLKKDKMLDNAINFSQFNHAPLIWMFFQKTL